MSASSSHAGRPALPHPRAPSPADPGLADRLLDHARLMLRKCRPLEALPMLDRLNRLPGMAGAAATLRAEALLGIGRLEAAEDAAAAALAEAPNDPQRLQLRARIRLTRGQGIGAIDDAAAAVMALPSDPAAKALLGMALLAERRFDEAVYFLGEAFRGDPANPMIQARLGQAFMLAGRHDAAAEMLEHCEASAPGLPGIAMLRAQGRLLTGDLEGAVTLAREALARGLVDAGTHSVLAHALVSQGRMPEAAPHFAAASRLAPNDSYLAHLAAAASPSGPAPKADRATDGYVTALFDGYAPRFEGSLLSLGYRVPGLMRRAVERLLPEVAAGRARLGPMLDLGCGTGMVGATLSDLLGDRLVGVDLSRAMLAEAAGKGIYGELRQTEIAAALTADPESYALITAADLFCYFGRLDEVLGLCRQRLAAGGLLLFNVERVAETPGGWHLNIAGRYAHTPDYVTACLAQAGLAAMETRQEDLRLDVAGAVPGLLVAARAVGH